MEYNWGEEGYETKDDAFYVVRDEDGLFDDEVNLEYAKEEMMFL